MSVSSKATSGSERRVGIMTDNLNQVTMERALAGLADGRAADFIALFADDIAWTIRGTTPWSRRYQGKRAVLDMLGALAARIDGSYRMLPQRIVADGDIVVVEGEGRNLLTTGDRYDNTYCWVCRFERGRLRELVEYMDTALVMRVFGGAAVPG
jgi:ketosteroid isomerase-like protein